MCICPYLLVTEVLKEGTEADELLLVVAQVAIEGND
jgi:hypothetical protein